MKTISFIICLLIFTVSSVFAEMKVETYTNGKDDPLVRIYILGVGRGYQWANTEFKAQGKQLFCPPEKTALQPDLFLNVLDKQIEKLKKMGFFEMKNMNFLVESILLQGLKDTFACEKK